jgi:NAD(P)-dependent dehydrogenase (short-subunit alcohol dehydrogenase family)
VPDQQARIAVVTGGGRGLGRAIALGLAGAGARVAAVARSADELAETERRATDLAGSVVGISCDVADHRAVETMAMEVRERLGQPGILINAAGTFGPIALVQDTDPEAWQRTIMVDAVAPYLTVRAFLAAMLDAGWGRIVNVSSAAALHPPGPVNSAYGTAKAALNQFTRHLAAEIAGTGVTANVIHPGDVKTAMWADIRSRVAGLGAVARDYVAWADWLEATGGDPPDKAVALVLRLTSDLGGSINGRFCWIDDPLQAPVPSWEPPVDDRPWGKG